MKVSDLIELLGLMPPDSEVLVERQAVYNGSEASFDIEKDVEYVLDGRDVRYREFDNKVVIEV